ncbi:MAG: hypothetical protein IKJ32_03300 [Clostridia bacterium]|nr:hypothetical protein [Clostridia bacterium]
MILVQGMLLALVITILMELIIACIFKVRNKKDLINIILVNICTNPLLVSITYVVFLKFGNTTQNIVEIFLEIIVFIIEGVLYRKYLKLNKINPYVFSAMLNLSSYILGSEIIDKIQNLYL